MSAVEERGSAPPVVRRIGYYYLALSALSVWVLIMSSLYGNLRWWQVVGLPIAIAIGVGLIREQRWAYVSALVFAGINVSWNLVVLTLVVIQPSHIGLVIGVLFTVMSFVIAAPPLFLLGERGRAWFQRREPAALPA